MTVEHAILALVIMLGLSLIAQPISRLSHLPIASILVLLGYVASELIVYNGLDTGLRADNFQSIIFYILIPVLVFESAINIDKAKLKKNLVVILFLAILTMLLTCLVVAVLLYYGIAHKTGFPWMAALITGAVLAATDPSAIIKKVRGKKKYERVGLLLEGESLFNDATAIVLFGLFMSIAMTTDGNSTNDVNTIAGITIQCVVIFIGGTSIGLLTGLFFSCMKKQTKKSELIDVMSLIAAYGAYLLAEYFGVSGVMSTLMAALMFSRCESDEEINSQKLITNQYLWKVLSHVANSSVFIIMGAVITFDMFDQRWLAMIIAVVSLLLARAVSIYGVLTLFMFFKDLKVPMSSQSIIVWGGLRGAVTLALALSLPTSLEYWWTIQSIAFGVVVFSLFVQAPMMFLLIKRSL